MFKKDTFRLIKKTKKRFLSLVLIVLIGVAFMMGLMSNPTIMRKSVDRYDDEYSLQDLQLYSPYGFCANDVIKLRSTEGIDEIMASKQNDFYCRRMDGVSVVTRAMELDRNINRFELVEGRLPENDNECVILYGLSADAYRIGQHLIFYLNDEDIHDYLVHDDYVIVGFVQSPEFLSKTLGSSNRDNKELSLVAYLPNSNFIFEYYTTIYLTLDGSKDMLSYTKEYEEYINENKENVEYLAAAQQEYLKDKITQEYQEELDEGKQEFEQQKTDGQKKLDDAKKELDDANIQIISAETQIEMFKNIIYRAESTIENGKISLEEEKNALYARLDALGLSHDIGYDQLIERIARYAIRYGMDSDQYDDLLLAAESKAKVDGLEEAMEYAQETLDTTKRELYSTKRQLEDARKQYEDGLIEYNDGILKFNEEIENAEAKLRKAQQDLDDLPNAEWMIMDRTYQYSSYMYDGTCKQMTSIGFALPFIFFLVAALVCMTTMTRLVDEQRGQIGIFVALGFTDKQIICKYCVYAFLAAVIGYVPGIIIGQLLFPTVIYDTWRLMYYFPNMKMLFPFLYLLLCFGCFAGLMMLVTFLVVKDHLKEVPALLMRPKSPKNAKAIILEKIPLIWENLSFTSKITARNIFRYKSRFFMTVIGVAGCTALLVVGWGIKDSISDVIDIQYGRIFGYDFQIYLDNDYHLENNLKILEEDLNNETVVPFMQYTSKGYFSKDDDTMDVIVMDPRDANYVLGLKHTDRKSDLKLDNEGVIVSQKFSINNDIKKGDYITIESRNGIKAEVKVADICEMYFQHYIFMSDKYYQMVFDENVYDICIGIKTNDYESLMEDCNRLEDFISVVDFSSMIESFQTMIEALDLIIAVIIITSGSLAFVVLINLTQVNISERIREIATLKVLGFNEREIDAYIFKEILLLTVIGGLVGLPLGVIEHHFIMNVINLEMVMFGMNISFMSFTYAFLVTFVFTAIVLLFMRKPLDEVNMIESLKSVE